MLGIEELIGLKLALLFHDPPNKMWVSARHLRHDVVAQEFAEAVLAGTVLEALYRKAITETKNLISRGDSLAASFDRWLLAVLRRHVGYYINYSYLHNIFDPSLAVKLDPRRSEVVEEGPKGVAASLKLVLTTTEQVLVNRPDTQKIPTLYNILYTLFEPTWYYHGLPPSLADTRTPTHTVFDHLYASASLANILDRNGFSGYYIILDFPGIQKFVASGRKAGDFWAASWILSNIVWRTGLEFAKVYGLDVILTPSPRLNPYTFKSILTLIEHGNTRDFYIATCESGVKASGNTGRLTEELCKMFAHMYGVEPSTQGRKWKEVDILINQPLIPAYMTLLLPATAASSPEDLTRVTQQYFVMAWKELYELVVERLLGGLGEHSDITSKYIARKLMEMKSILEVPPHGVRVYAVRVDAIYKDLEACVSEGLDELCSKFGLSLDHPRLTKLLCRDVDDVEGCLQRLAERLLYHVLVSRGIYLASQLSYGHHTIPNPRPFYYYGNDGGLKHLIEYETSCSLCGDEPAAVKLGKVFSEGGILEYDKAALEDISSAVGEDVASLSTELMGLKKVLKPGEALGPYCLLKRAVYYTFRKTLEVMSTDDVALLRVSRIVSENHELFGRVFSRLEERLFREGALVDVLRHLYEHQREVLKDIEVSAEVLGLSFDTFVSKSNKCISETCAEALSERAQQVLEAVVKAYALSTQAVSPLSQVIRSKAKEILKRLCGIMTIPTSYAIVRGDADNIGKLLQGIPVGYANPSEFLKQYADILLRSVRERGEVITEQGLSSDVLSNLGSSYKALADLVEALGLRGIPVSPAWHSSVSLSLILSAVEDYKVSKELDGLLVFTGGDDVLAFYPIHTALSAAREHRRRFMGDGFKYVGGGVPVASSVMTGRSFSVRFVNLKDVMSEEVTASHELLEETAKRARWFVRCREEGGREKDSIVISDSRTGSAAVLPQVLTTHQWSDQDNIYVYIDRLIFAITTDLVSRNLPEDLEGFLSEYVLDLKAGFNQLLKHILGRNLKGVNKSDEEVKDVILSNILDDIYAVSGCVNGRETNLAIEAFTELFRILRRHVG